MSETETKFEIEVNEEVTLRRDSMVEHAEHGPMRVDSIRVGPYHKTAELKSEIGPIGLELTDEEIQEQWGEAIAQDPFELHDPGTAKYTNSGITVEGSDIEVDVTVSGPENEAEKVTIHAVDEIVRAMEALRDEQVPSECDGAPMSVHWEGLFGDE